MTNENFNDFLKYILDKDKIYYIINDINTLNIEASKLISIDVNKKTLHFINNIPNNGYCIIMLQDLNNNKVHLTKESALLYCIEIFNKQINELEKRKTYFLKQLGDK